MQMSNVICIFPLRPSTHKYVKKRNVMCIQFMKRIILRYDFHGIVHIIADDC